MKTTFMKLIAFILTAAVLVGLVGNGLALVYLVEAGLYQYTPEDLKIQRLDNFSLAAASYSLSLYLLESNEDPEDDEPGRRILWNQYEEIARLVSEGKVAVVIRDLDGDLLLDTQQVLTTPVLFTGEYTMEAEEIQVVPLDSPQDQAIWQQVYEAAGSPTEATEYLRDSVWEIGEDWYRSYSFQGERYHVQVLVTGEVWNELYETEWEVTRQISGNRHRFVAGFIICALLTPLGFVYLGWAAGMSRGRKQPELRGLNRLPMDLYLAIASFLVYGLGFLTMELLDFSYGMINLPVMSDTLALAALGIYVCAVAILCAYYALAAQLKMGNWLILKNSLIGRLLRQCFRFLRWMVRQLVRSIGLLPLTWQWVLGTSFMGMILILGTLWSCEGGWVLPLLVALFLCGGLCAYWIHCFGKLARGVQQMSRGELHYKVSTKHLLGSFRDFARNLNRLSDAALLAAKKQTQSDRMRTELITNVSHDIKTPLTSIINFVDLLQKPHTPAQEQEYLEVLSRQSHRMKKLVEDLVELSKANTGNLPVEIRTMDAIEVLNQALGEFSDTLDAAGLTPVVNLPQGPIPMQADGKLAWRVLSNLLSNVVKYALPGTRVYLDLIPLPGKVLISLKNISREQLGMHAEELMERFVRGDTSRNTEGSGLGLNIARSLMEVQQGQLQLLLDGDLFKVTIVFPAETQES